MPLSDILNCKVDDLWTILDSHLDSGEPYDQKHWFLSKGIGSIELSQLGEMLGVDSYDNLMAGLKLVGEPRDEGPWPQTIPAALTNRLATITDDEIAAVVPRWVELEEFQPGATVDSLTEYLQRLRSFLAERSGEFFLVNAL
jgi:hypothetical protein